jgi:hypothetical protein
MYVNELIGFDAAEADREILCWKFGARRLRVVDGGRQAPAQRPLPPALELVDGGLSPRTGRRRPRRRGGAA